MREEKGMIWNLEGWNSCFDDEDVQTRGSKVYAINTNCCKVHSCPEGWTGWKNHMVTILGLS